MLQRLCMLPAIIERLGIGEMERDELVSLGILLAAFGARMLWGARPQIAEIAQEPRSYSAL